MDYAFAPAGGWDPVGYQPRLHEMMRLRNNNNPTQPTTMLDPPAVRSIRQLVTGLAAPVGDLLLGGHAHREGVMLIPAYDPTIFQFDYETLVASLDAAHPERSLAIDPGVFVGGGPTHSVDLKGCNLGKSRPFLAKLKEALGNQVSVTAPKHFHGLTEDKAPGIVEYMEYEFILRVKGRPDGRPPFANRAAAIAAFEAATAATEDFRTITPDDKVTPELWRAWIGKGPLPTEGKKTPKKIWVPLGVNVGGMTEVKVDNDLALDVRKFDFEITYPSKADVPAKDQREAALRTIMRDQDPQFSAAAGWPYHERRGFTTFDSFFDIHIWTFDVKSFTENGAKVWKLLCAGKYFEYTQAAPIRRANGNLVFNFYTKDATKAAPIQTGFTVTDVAYFARV